MALLVAVAACGSGEPESGAGAGGAGESEDPSVVAASPTAGASPRVVSLLPPATEVLQALGAGEHLVGRALDDPFLVDSDLPDVGSLVSPAAEPLIQLQPDLILHAAGSLPVFAVGRVRPVQAALRPVKMERLADYPEAVRSLGEWVGREEEARAMAAEMEADLALVSAGLEGRVSPSVLWLLWDDPLIAVGPGTLQNDLLRAAGGVNVLLDERDPWPRLEPGRLADLEPDLVLWSGPVERRPDGRALTAEITSLDPDLFNGPGSRAAEAVRDLAGVLYPDTGSDRGPESRS
jgi:iron complex transport system substrate-binding protein